MKIAKPFCAVACVLLLALRAAGTNVVITAFHSNGELSWTNTTEFSRFDIEWAPEVAGPWTNSWEHLAGIANTATTHTVAVPVFFRVIGHTWPTSTFLVHADGTQGTTSFVDQNGHAVSALEHAHISTNQSVFGGASARFDGDGDVLVCSNSADFGFSTNDFTVDFRVMFQSVGHQHLIGMHRAGVNNDWAIFLNHGETLYLETGAGNSISGAWTPVVDTWYHIAATRESGYARLFVDGSPLAEGALNTDITYAYPLTIAGPENSESFSMEFDGYLDEIRIINGEAAWTSDFPPPGIPYGR